MAGRRELSELLKSRRARLRPEDVGLRDYGGLRRAAGLRWEEPARLAGVRIAYFMRLEQGKGETALAEVLDGGCSALRLDAVGSRLCVDGVELAYLADELAYLGEELAYLRGIAWSPRTGAGLVTLEVSAGSRHLLESFVMTSALVVGGCRTEIVGWDGLGVAVVGDFAALLGGRCTVSCLLFVESRLRGMLRTGWERAEREDVAHMRVLLGRRRDGPGLAAYVGRLRDLSPEFVCMWSEHRVGRARLRAYARRNPHAGELTLYGELVALPGAPTCSGARPVRRRAGFGGDQGGRCGETERFAAADEWANRLSRRRAGFGRRATGVAGAREAQAGGSGARLTEEHG